jgi:hypothetical protein
MLSVAKSDFSRLKGNAIDFPDNPRKPVQGRPAARNAILCRKMIEDIFA